MDEMPHRAAAVGALSLDAGVAAHRERADAEARAGARKGGLEVARGSAMAEASIGVSGNVAHGTQV